MNPTQFPAQFIVRSELFNELLNPIFSLFKERYSNGFPHGWRFTNYANPQPALFVAIEIERDENTVPSYNNPNKDVTFINGYLAYAYNSELDYESNFEIVVEEKNVTAFDKPTLLRSITFEFNDSRDQTRKTIRLHVIDFEDGHWGTILNLIIKNSTMRRFTFG